MSRTRRALVASGFAYVQFASAIVVGIVLVPLILGRLGARTYGLWLASGEVLAYVALLDFGIFAVMPWMIAEADGRRDRDAVRSFVSQGLAVGAAVGAVYLVVVGLGWTLLPDVIGLTAADRYALAGPVRLLVTITAVTYPLSVFVAVLTGLQDFTFTGILSVIRSTLTAAIIIALLLNDAGLYALAAGAAIPALVTLVASAVRVGVIAPDLLKGWPRPTWAGLTSLFGSSVGAWLGGFGWKLIAASNSLVIAFLGHPEWIAVYVCTARLGGMLQQMSWVVPDSGLVGLAQLSGEGRPARMREVTTSLLRLYVILSGLVTLAILAVNPAFVRWWVGADYFGGITLNALLAAGAVVASFVHGVSVVPSVLGRRLEVGTAVIVNGLVQLALAVPLGARYGLNGIALASILAAIVTTLPAGVVLLGRTTGLETRWLIGGVIGTWSLRAAPLVAVAAVLGFWGRSLSVFLVAALAAPIGLAYVWRMRPLYRDFPLDPRFRRLLATLGLAPPVPEPAVGAPEPG